MSDEKPPAGDSDMPPAWFRETSDEAPDHSSDATSDAGEGYRPRRSTSADEAPTPAEVGAPAASTSAASTPEASADSTDPDATAVRPAAAAHDDSAAAAHDDSAAVAEDDAPSETAANQAETLGEFDRHHPFTRSLIKTLASALLPGLGLVRSRASKAGVAITGAVVLALLALAAWVISDPVGAAATAVRPSVLRPLSIALVFIAALWIVTIVGTHLITRPRARTRTQAIVGALVVGGLSFAIAAPMAIASRYTATQAGLVSQVFGSEKKKSQTRPTIDTKGQPDDVWAKKPRLNILLVGLDNTKARAYEDNNIRSDTMMVASIETATGNMVVTQIPRNMARVPFPPGSELAKRYPEGFYDGVDADNANFFANALWSQLPDQQPDLFKNTDYKGADALKLGMEGALGLKIDYFLALDIDGLVTLIDAMGGVRINVNQRIPVGSSDTRAATGYIEPGQNKLLSGYYAMWYARARHGIEGGDYNRMGRQTCVIKGVIDQADPATMLTRYEAIAKASQDMISTDIPQDLLPALLELARRMKNGKQTRVLFVHEKDGFITYKPDYPMMRARVQQAIKTVGEAPAGAPTKKPSDEGTAGATTGQTPGASETSAVEPSESSPSASEAEASEGGASGSSSATPPPAESLTDACAWNPVEASASPTPER